MYFFVVATGSRKYVKVTDLLLESKPERIKECEEDQPKRFEVTSSGSDNTSGLVKIDVSRDGNNYGVFRNRIGIREGGEPIEIGD